MFAVETQPSESQLLEAQPSETQAVPDTILSGRITPTMTFNEKVWSVCCKVPTGKVTTYGAIARRLGTPNAARAVGVALNRNPYAPTVPCHRVIGADRTLTGYAGGLDKKREMLLAEGVEFDKDRVSSASVVDV